MEDFLESFKECIVIKPNGVEIKVTPAVKFKEAYFWDSIAAVSVCAMIYQKYKISMYPAALVQYDTIQELYDFVAIQNSK